MQYNQFFKRLYIHFLQKISYLRIALAVALCYYRKKKMTNKKER